MTSALLPPPLWEISAAILWPESSSADGPDELGRGPVVAPLSLSLAPCAGPSDGLVRVRYFRNHRRSCLRLREKRAAAGCSMLALQARGC